MTTATEAGTDPVQGLANEQRIAALRRENLALEQLAEALTHSLDVAHQCIALHETNAHLQEEIVQLRQQISEVTNGK